MLLLMTMMAWSREKKTQAGWVAKPWPVVYIAWDEWPWCGTGHRFG
jgi:hypothetical protein